MGTADEATRSLMETIEPMIQNGVQWLRLVIETVGALIIAAGLLVAASTFIQAALARRTPNFSAIRLSFARFLALALEFQLGADILSTAIAPTWDAIGKLGAIAIIRTALNYFLTREMQAESPPVEAQIGRETAESTPAEQRKRVS